MLDPTINFGKVTLLTGYDAAATSVNLQPGDGAKLPDTALGAFNLVWWNVTDYPDPADDPNKEVVRVTNRLTDALAVIRAQEGTSASTKNTAGKTYMMILGPTKKTMDDIESQKVPYSGATGNVDLGGNSLFSSKVKTGIIYPASDSTTAVQINKAGGTTNVLSIDTTNSRLGIGVTPTSPLHVKGGAIGNPIIKTEDSSGRILSIEGESINRYDSDSDSASITINRYGYNEGTTRYRDLGIMNGKNAFMAYFDGSSGMVGIGKTNPIAGLDVRGSYMNSCVAMNGTILNRLFGNIMYYADKRYTVTTSGSISSPGNLFIPGDAYSQITDATLPIVITVENSAGFDFGSIASQCYPFLQWHGGATVDVKCELKATDGTWKECYANASTVFSTDEFKLFGATDTLSYPTESPCKGIRFTISNFTGTKYIRQLGIFMPRGKNAYPFLTIGGGETIWGNITFGNNQQQTLNVMPSITDVAGNGLIIRAGNTVAGTSTDNVNGGGLVLQAGLGTGTGTSTISFQTGTTLTTGKTLQTMSTKMTILGSGYVGIGTTAPDDILHISKTGDYTIPIYSTSPNGTVTLKIGEKQSGGTYYGWDFKADGANDRLDIISQGFGNSGTIMTLYKTKKVGISGVTSPTAYLHIAAGTASAATAPLKFTSGTLNTVAEPGAIEFLTDDYYATITTSAVRKKIVLTTTDTAPDYTITNASTDRALDCDSCTLDELADVVGSLITDLQATNIIQ